MNNRDFAEIAKLLTREDCDLAERVINIQNRINYFRHIDVYDSFELLEIKVTQEYFDGFEQRLLRLCDYLVKNNEV